MAVIDTKDWLEREFTDPVKIVAKCHEGMSKENTGQFYRYLKKHGMYTPSPRSRKDLDSLIEIDIWGKVEKVFNKYKQLWNGFDIPVFIFPFRNSGSLARTKENKSGLAFKDMMFLFVHPGISEKELEAVFVHEYHHVCRLNKLKGKQGQYTLLDSIIMEGLAENAVSKHVGKEYLAHWTSLYNDRELITYYERYIKERLHTKQTNELHDALLYGKKPYPSMLGYCIGYYMVCKHGLVPVKKSFMMPSREFLKKMDS